MYYIGIDLGTSACKFLLLNEQGAVLRAVSREYPLSFPHPGWSEQDPQDWWDACRSGIPALLEGFDPKEVAGIGAGGQMHGLVALDRDDRVLRPAILWNDGRTADEVEYLNETVGRDVLSARTGNIAFAGFTAPKLLWMRRHEPELFEQIEKIMLPKDYVNYKLTGAHATDYSDASGTLLLDVAQKCWSREMLALCGMTERQMPALYESFSPIGVLRPEAAAELHLPEGITVCAGAGDNAAAAVGTGAVSGASGNCNISLGTSGTVFIPSKTFGVDDTNGLHAFCHADGAWHLMGCMLSAASCNKWWQEEILGTSDFQREEAAISPEKLGRNHVYYLPYLMGERSPINDTNARAAFLGMTMDSTRADMTQAMLEGVAFAIRDSFEVAKGLGIAIPRSCICGGGAKSLLWQKILSNVLNIPLDTVTTEQGPGYGGAMLAMVACGVFPTVQAAAQALVRIQSTVEPEPELSKLYEVRYRQFQKIYPACKSLFPQLL